MEGKRGSWEGIWEIIVWDQRCVWNGKDGGVMEYKISLGGGMRREREVDERTESVF